MSANVFEESNLQAQSAIDEIIQSDLCHDRAKTTLTYVAAGEPSQQLGHVKQTPASSGRQQRKSGKGKAASRSQLVQIGRNPSRRHTKTPGTDFKRALTRHGWTIHEKSSLALLKLFFDIKWQDVPKVLNSCFPRRSSPFHKKMASQTYAMAKLRDPSSTRTQWTNILENQVFSLSKPAHQKALQRLEKAAMRCGIVLRRRHSDAELLRLKEQRGFGILSASRPAKPLPDLNVEESYGQTTIRPSQQATQGKQCVAVVITRRLPRSTSSTTYLPPRLVFRTFSRASGGINERHQFRAGFYSFIPNAPISAAPVDWTSDDFLIDARNHLAGSQTGTKLISVSPSLVWCIYRALKTEAAGEPANISIINGFAAAQASAVYDAAPIIREIKRRHWWDPRRFHYKATQELFIWGAVDAAAIHNSVSLAELRRFAESNLLVRKFLRLGAIGEARTMNSLLKRLFNDGIVLDGASGLVVGLIARWLGVSPVDGQDATCAAVYALLQGWKVAPPSSADDQESAWIGFWTAFTASANSAALVALGAEREVRKGWTTALQCATADYERTRKYLRRTK